MKEIPDGFEKMNLLLTVTKGSSHIIETQVLKMLVCSHHIFYTKKPHLKEWFCFEFYCRPKEETRIAYLIGIYNQTMMKYHTVNQIKNAIHSVPENFPECIRLELDQNTPTE